MTDTTAAQALKTLREGLRSETVGDIDALVELLRTCLASLHGAGADEPTRKAIQRYLPSIQIQLVTTTIPTFYHALDDEQRSILSDLFVPARAGADTAEQLRISRWIALTSYLTLPPFLNASSTPALPVPARTPVIDILASLAGEYGIDQMYWAVWGGVGGSPDEQQGKGEGELAWEEVNKSLASIPAKCANAVGRWSGEGWTGDMPVVLEPK